MANQRQFKRAIVKAEKVINKGISKIPSAP